MMKRIMACFIALALVFGLYGSAWAQAGDSEGKSIADIKVRGNNAVSSATILSRMKLQKGDTFQETALNSELKRLYSTGYFSDVFVETEDRAEGIVVIFTVVEKPVIGRIEFRGNAKLKANKLMKKVTAKEGTLLDFNVLAHDVGEIKNYYVEQGYSNVSIDYRIEADSATERAVVVFVVDEGAPLKIKAISFEGNKAISSGELAKYMATKTAWWFIRKGAYDESKFEEDLSRIKTVYRTKGYLDAKVTSRIDYSEDGKGMLLTVIVNEGKRYSVGEVVVAGELAFPENEIAELIKIKTGDAFDFSEVKEDIDNVRAFYYDRGYMDAEIDLQHKYNHTTERMDLIFNITANDEIYVGKINVIGNTKTKDKIVRRELRLFPGEKYDGAKLKKSKERIYNLGFFEDVYFDTMPTSTSSVKDLDVTVKETKTGELSFGGGYSSVDAFIGFAQVRQRNFDIMAFPTFMGGGQDFKIRAEIGSDKMDYLLSWTDPWIFDLPYLFGFDLYREEHSRSGNSGYGYDETRTGGNLRLGKEITDELSTGLVYTMEEVKISNIPDNATDDLRKEQGSNLISRLSWNVAYDTRDNRFAPTKGFVTGFSLENAGGPIGGDKDFVKGYLYGSYYHSIIERVVLEIKGRTGIVESYGDSDSVPIYERFFAGGATTIRGYEQRGVGPRDRGTNTALGGEAMSIGNAEITFPVYKNIIKGAVFYDVGVVHANAKDLFTGTDYKQGTGIGVRVKTPIGPIKLDYGFPLSNNYDDKKEGQFYFSVTHGF